MKGMYNITNSSVDASLKKLGWTNSDDDSSKKSNLLYTFRDLGVV
jgi:hypothetical protein